MHAHKHEMSGPPVRPSATTLFLMVGLPGAGKTTVAQELAISQRALRLTPDEWHLPLFGVSLTADGKRDILEGRLITVALRTLRLGISVVLDFGLWSRDERSALRWLADEAEVLCEVVYLPVELDVQLARIAHRQATTPGGTFPMPEADIVSLAQPVRSARCRRARGPGRPLPTTRVVELGRVGDRPMADARPVHNLTAHRQGEKASYNPRHRWVRHNCHHATHHPAAT